MSANCPRKRVATTAQIRAARRQANSSDLLTQSVSKGERFKTLPIASRLKRLPSRTLRVSFGCASAASSNGSPKASDFSVARRSAS